jgi:hypothetical protein
MTRFLGIIVTITWGLWFGGMIVLFLFVVRLFAAGIGPEAAPVLFRTFETYQLVVGAIAIVASLGWFLSNRSRWKTGLLVAMLVSGVLAVLLTTLITPRMDKLRLAGESRGDEFRMLHKRSEKLFVGAAAALLIGGIAIGMETRAKSSGVS